MCRENRARDWQADWCTVSSGAEAILVWYGSETDRPRRQSPQFTSQSMFTYEQSVVSGDQEKTEYIWLRWRWGEEFRAVDGLLHWKEQILSAPPGRCFRHVRLVLESRAGWRDYVSHAAPTGRLCVLTNHSVPMCCFAVLLFILGSLLLAEFSPMWNVWAQNVLSKSPHRHCCFNKTGERGESHFPFLCSCLCVIHSFITIPQNKWKNLPLFYNALFISANFFCW